jgi:hypothetical protein
MERHDAQPAQTPPGKAHGPTLLILQNPGRQSRFYMTGLIRAASTLNLRHLFIEMGSIWEMYKRDAERVGQQMAYTIDQFNISAVLSYGHNGVIEFGGIRLPNGDLRGLFTARQIPHLMLWTDHPHWFIEGSALLPEMQPLLRGGNNHHFLKSEAAALEIQQFLRWPNCRAVHMAEDTQLLPRPDDISADFDVVAICGGPGALGNRLLPLIEQDDPDIDEAGAIVADDVVDRLDAVWRDHAPANLQADLGELGRRWVERRRREFRIAAIRHFNALAEDHPRAARWLADNPLVYIEAVKRLWGLGNWQRSFYLRYLARFFRVGVFGADWSPLGIGGSDQWVDYLEQTRIYARGHVAINIVNGNDEEGIAHKPFQIAASGVAMAHNEQVGLADCFTPGEQVAVFHTPFQARQAIADLLEDPDRRQNMAESAYERLCREHTWPARLRQMMQSAGLNLSDFEKD